MLKITSKLIACKGLRCLKNLLCQIQKLLKKIKSLFMMCADFESILEPDDNGKKNIGESYKIT